MQIFDHLESEVRGYCRAFPTVFDRAEGSHLYDREGRAYVDFFAGAGVMSYGHNNPKIKAALLGYLERNGLVHGLDLATAAKSELLETFEEVILRPRQLDYKVQFPGPTGTNAVESALKLARKATGRRTVVCFTNGYHGMTLGALAVTGSSHHRGGAGVPLDHVVRLPYDGYGDGEIDSLAQLEAMLGDPSSGVEIPAAFILETLQAEGGVRPASFPWLQRLAALAERHGILLIVDDIQVGCGRTGPFFSFEPAGIVPDIVCLSKALSGYGLPFALVLMKRHLDVWKPGEHNGTFRGHNLAFVTATAALDYWRDDTLTRSIEARSAEARKRLEGIAAAHPELCGAVRGRGLILGLPICPPERAAEVSREAFGRGLLVEVAGPYDEVVKVMPPLVIEPEDLASGLTILEESVRAVAHAHVASTAVGSPVVAT